MKSFLSVILLAWVLVSDGTWRDQFGAIVPAGQIVNVITYDGNASYQPPPGTTLRQDNGTLPTWVPQAPQ